MMPIYTPNLTDVLCGKDKTYELHPGNQRYRDLITSYALQYAMATTKQDKMNMTAQIVSDLTSGYGSRFLRRADSGGWEELRMSAARDKTSHALRFCAAHLGMDRPVPTKELVKHVPQNKAAKRGLKRKVSFDETKKTEVTPDVPKSTHLLDNGVYTEEGNSESNYLETLPTNLLLPDLTSPFPSAHLHDITSGYDRIIAPLPLDYEPEFDAFPEDTLQYLDFSL